MTHHRRQALPLPQELVLQVVRLRVDLQQLLALLLMVLAAAGAVLRLEVLADQEPEAFPGVGRYAVSGGDDGIPQGLAGRFHL